MFLLAFITWSLNINPKVNTSSQNTKTELLSPPPDPLHAAVIQGFVSVTKKLIEEQNYDPDCLDSIQRTPLHYAAMGGRLVIIKYLVLSNADPLSEDVFHNLPLHYAAALGHLDIVKFLVNIGSPYTTRGALNMTPTEMATAGGHFDILLYLVKFESTGV